MHRFTYPVLSIKKESLQSERLFKQFDLGKKHSSNAFPTSTINKKIND